MQPDCLDFHGRQLADILARDTGNANGGEAPRGHGGSDVSGCENGRGTEKNRKGRILAVIPTHLFGCQAEVEGVRPAGGGPPPYIIEDAAQAMGAERNGRKAGTRGDVGIFSLGRGKVLSTVEGGVILTNRTEIAQRIEMRIGALTEYKPLGLLKLIAYANILWVFSRPSLFWIPKLFPFLRLGETLYDPEFSVHRMSYFQAGMLRDWKRRLAKCREKRSENVQRWTALLKNTPWKTFASGKGEGLIRFPVLSGSSNERREILEAASRNGLGFMPGYPDSIDGIVERHVRDPGEAFPEGKKFANRLFTLPTHPYLSRGDCRRIEACLLHAAKRSGREEGEAEFPRQRR